MAKKEALYKKTSLVKAASSIKKSSSIYSITYNSIKIGRQSCLINLTFLRTHKCIFKKDHQQSYDKAKPCTYVQSLRIQFSLCKLNETSMSSNET